MNAFTVAKVSPSSEKAIDLWSSRLPSAKQASETDATITVPHKAEIRINASQRRRR